MSALYKSLSRYGDDIKHPQPALAMKFGHEASLRLLRSSILYQDIDFDDLHAQGVEVTDTLLATQAARIWEAYLRSAE